MTSRASGAADALWDVGRRLCSAGEQEGEFPTAWHAHGYRGASINGLAYGARGDGCYVRLSGRKCAEHWFEALTTAENCTRIDLAVDTQFHRPVTTLVDECYLEIPDALKHRGRPPMRRLVKDTRGGQTLYFGARSSERFGRLYDKGVEAKTDQPGRRWRWELEAKQNAAQTFAHAIARAESPTSFIQGAVAGFFHARCGVSIAELSRSVISNESQDPPSAARLLQWLAIGVRPTVAKLVKVYGRQRVLHSLGISLNSAVDDHKPIDVPPGGRT